MALSTRVEGIQWTREMFKRYLNSGFHISCLRILCVYIETLGLSAMHRDLGKLEKWACANLMKFNMAKHKVLHVGQSNPRHKHRVAGEWIEGAALGEGRRCCG